MKKIFNFIKSYNNFIIIINIRILNIINKTYFNIKRQYKIHKIY